MRLMIVKKTTMELDSGAQLQIILSNLIAEIRKTIYFDLAALAINEPDSTDLLISVSCCNDKKQTFPIKIVTDAICIGFKIINGSLFMKSRLQGNKDIELIDLLFDEDERFRILSSLVIPIEHDMFGQGLLLVGSQRKEIILHRKLFAGINFNAVIEKVLDNQSFEGYVEEKQDGLENLYQSAFKQSTEPGLIFKRDGTIIIINDALEQLYGDVMSQFIARSSLEDLFQRRHRKRIADHYRHISARQIKSLQVLFQCYDGSDRIVELRIRPIDAGDLLCATLIDLTEYKVYERRVEELVGQISIINEIVAAINSNINKNQLIRIFFNQINKIFGYDLACIALSDIEDKEIEIHYSKEASEIESRKCTGLFYQAFTEGLSSCQQIEQQPQAISNITDIIGLQGREGYRSQVLIQLKTDEQLIGAVILFSQGEDALNQYHIDIFREISDQIAIAFLKARLLQKYQQSLTNLSFLARINESLSSSLDLDVVLKQVVESSLQIIHAKICTIHSLKTEFKFTGNFIKSYEDNFIDRFKPQIQQVIIDQQPLIIENIDYNNIQFFKSRLDIQKLGLKSLIILPIKANGTTIALLSVFGDKVHYFNEHEVELLAMLADQAAIAIMNAQHYNRLEQTKNYLESIIHSSTHIIISTDLEGNITFFSNSAYQLTGYSIKEVLNQPFFKRFIKNGSILLAGLREELLAKNNVQSFECEIVTKNNQTVPISWLFSPLIDQHKEVIGVLAIGKDIAKHQKYVSQSTK